MKRSPFARLLRSLVAGSGLALLAVAIGCIDQAEGDRCSTLTGTDSDCEVGLRCTPASELNLTGGANGDGRCCPPDRTQATTDVCRINVSPGGGDAGIPIDNPIGGDSGADATVTDGPGTDAGSTTETGTDADTSSDANASGDVLGNG